MTALKPTPPRPKITAEEPGSAAAVLTMAPTPVRTAQPKGGPFRRNGPVDLHHRALDHDGMIGERRDAQVMVERAAVRPGQPPAAGQQRAGQVRARSRLAQGRAPGQA